MPPPRPNMSVALVDGPMDPPRPAPGPKPKSLRPTWSCCISRYRRARSLSFFSAALRSFLSRSFSTAASRSRSLPLRTMLFSLPLRWSAEDEDELRGRSTGWADELMLTDRLAGRFIVDDMAECLRGREGEWFDVLSSCSLLSIGASRWEPDTDGVRAGDPCRSPDGLGWSRRGDVDEDERPDGGAG